MRAGELLGVAAATVCALASIGRATGESAHTPTCVGCVSPAPPRSPRDMRDNIEQNEMVKILWKLGLEDRPNVSIASSQLSPFLYRRSVAGFHEQATVTPFADDDDSVEAKRLYLHGERSTLDCCTNCTCMQFTTNQDFYSNRIVNASLWLHAAQDNGFGDSARLGSHGSPLQTVDVLSADNDWIELNVTHMAHQWQDEGKQERVHTLEIADWTARSGDGPLLEMQLTASSEARTRRRRENRCSPDRYTHCCLQRYWVNFTTIGWSDWVIRPHGYYANYCTGNCRLSSEKYGAVMTRVADMLRIRGKQHDSRLRPCCAPRGLMGDLHIIYALSLTDIRRKVLKNMIVQQCGC